MATNLKDIKVAIVTDWLWKVRGAEKVLDAVAQIFPNSEIFTLFGDLNVANQIPNISGKKIHFSWLNKLPLIKLFYRYTYFLWPLTIEQFDFEGFDLVFSISSSVAKGVITKIDIPHICYMNSPMRYAWDLSDEYFNSKNFSFWKRLVIPFFLHFLRIWDVNSNHMDYLISNSKYISKRINKYYNLTPDRIINPFVDKTDNYIDTKPSLEYYLYHGALEYNKGVIECLESAIKYGFNLKVSGSGSLYKKILKMSRGHANIEILGWIDDSVKFELMRNAKALLFVSKEDFGIVALESISVGTPVIAYNQSGTREIIQEGVNGILVKDVNEDEIYKATQVIKLKNIKRETLPNSIKEYSRERFQNEIKEVINSFLE